ncbi:MAG: aldo/keto reductase [Gloeomargarita sp. SKYBB_i_bin120]|nr:aldo/keto reductase [Gloeomargarita sp. SKYG98]MCS7292378.1 aldo/keto reductase [Gloeomargarita sp. SKYB120]MDW8177938.1 aldo/keto reductase [Gloeomargarita sp. SKYBB_i_bin120]
MEYRRFGRTELPMPVFSCGGMRYQYKWQDQDPAAIPKENQENLRATIHRAWEVGITHIETARGYGTSEMQLGWVLGEFPREKLIVQTKVPPSPDPQVFAEKFATSLRYLQLEYVDLLAIHGINLPEHLEWSLQVCLPLVRQWQREGRVRFVGFSTHGHVSLITQAIQTGEFDYVNLHWYYIFQENWPAILAAQQQDMGVFIISPSDKGGHLYNPPEKLVRLCQPLHPLVFNDLFCLSHPQVHTLSIGAARPSDFDTHLQTLPLLPKAPQVLPPILQRLEEAAIQALGRDWYEQWAVNLPPWFETPGEINMPLILRLLNLAEAFDLWEYSRTRYSMLGPGGHWVPGRNAADLPLAALRACLSRHPQPEEVLRRLQRAHQLLGGATGQRLSGA